MNKIKKLFLGLALVFVAMITLAGCSKVSQSYADKINAAAKTDTPITYQEAKEALGKECSDWTLGGYGIIFAIKGYQLDNEEDFKKLLNEGDKTTKYEMILIVCDNEKCKSASYISGTGEQMEEALSQWSLK